MTLKQLVDKVQEAQQAIINGLATQYIRYEQVVGDGDNINWINWTIRVGDHLANNARVDEHTISFVIDVPSIAGEDDEEEDRSIIRKQFRSFPNQYYIKDGRDESGYSIADILSNYFENN